MKRRILLFLSISLINCSFYAYNPEHLRHLKQFGECPNCDLSACNLSVENILKTRTLVILPGMIIPLEKLNLEKADLTGANLEGLDLTNANLQGATLKDASLKECNLTNAMMVETNCEGTDFSNAQFEKTDISYANLSEAQLQGARITQSDFTDSNLKKVTTDKNTLIKNSDFSGAFVETSTLMALKAPELNNTLAGQPINETAWKKESDERAERRIAYTYIIEARSMVVSKDSFDNNIYYLSHCKEAPYTFITCMQLRKKFWQWNNEKPICLFHNISDDGMITKDDDDYSNYHIALFAALAHAYRNQERFAKKAS